MNWRALGLAMVLVVAACGGGGGGASNPTPSAQAIPFTLNAVDNNGVSGDGTITKMSGKFTVTLRLKGLVANSSHMSHIHKGSCAPASQGDVVTVLENVKADGAGSGTATTSVSHPYSVPSTGWYVNVHAGPDFSKAEYVDSIACGDLTAG
jgi:CHRD domain